MNILAVGSVGDQNWICVLLVLGAVHIAAHHALVTLKLYDSIFLVDVVEGLLVDLVSVFER